MCARVGRGDQTAALQNGITYVEENLTKLAQKYSARDADLAHISRSFRNQMVMLKSRAATLQKYAQLLVDGERKLSAERREFNAEIRSKSRESDMETLACEGQLKEVRSKLVEFTEQRIKTAQIIDEYKTRIQDAQKEEETLDELVKRITLKIFETKHSPSAEAAVNVSIEIQKLKDEMNEVETDILDTRTKVVNLDGRIQELTDNRAIIEEIHRVHGRIPQMEEKVQNLRLEIKEIKGKQRGAKSRHVLAVAEFNQVMRQSDEYRRNLKVQKKLRTALPIETAEKGTSVTNLKEKLREEQEKMAESKTTEMALSKEVEELKTLCENMDSTFQILNNELEMINGKLDSDASYSKEQLRLYRSQMNEQIADQVRLKIQNSSFSDDKEVFDARNAELLKQEDLLQELKKLEDEKKELHIAIEACYWELNVLEAEFNRLRFDKASIDKETRKMRLSFPVSDETDTRPILKTISELGERVTQKARLNKIRADKINRRKKQFEDEMEHWTKRSLNTSGSTGSISPLFHGSPMNKAAQAPILERYLAKLSDSFVQQTDLWTDQVNPSEFRDLLRSWGRQLDLANSKLSEMASK